MDNSKPNPAPVVQQRFKIAAQKTVLDNFRYDTSPVFHDFQIPWTIFTSYTYQFSKHIFEERISQKGGF